MERGLKEARHTPGPWRATHYGKVISIDAPNDKRGGIGLAFINPGDDTEKGIPSPRDAANGRLMAAAPRMLETLKRTYTWLGWLIADGNYKGCAMPRDAELTFDLVGAAIAEGEPGPARVR